MVASGVADLAHGDEDEVVRAPGGGGFGDEDDLASGAVVRLVESRRDVVDGIATGDAVGRPIC